MKLESDRIAGLIIATLGWVLLFVIFPVAIEDIEGGSIQPDTLPNALAGFLAAWPYNYWRLKKHGKCCH